MTASGRARTRRSPAAMPRPSGSGHGMASAGSPGTRMTMRWRRRRSGCTRTNASATAHRSGAARCSASATSGLPRRSVLREWVSGIPSSRKLARAIGNEKAPGLFTEGFYIYSVFSSSLDVSNHHLNLLLAQQFIFCLRDCLEPLRVLALRALPYDLLRASFASSNDLFGCAICSTHYSNRLNKGASE